MEGFKYSIGDVVYTCTEGEISKHLVRGYYNRPSDGAKIYVIITYGRESLIKENNTFATLDEAKSEAIGHFEVKRSELNGKILAIQELPDMELTEERHPKQIAEDQKAEEQKAIEEGSPELEKAEETPAEELNEGTPENA